MDFKRIQFGVKMNSIRKMKGLKKAKKNAQKQKNTLLLTGCFSIGGLYFRSMMDQNSFSHCNSIRPNRCEIDTWQKVFGVDID